ncbi:MAG: hypothetical protein GXY07_14555, partial [Candidatus Hydrogenedentes bacterium]|nr:hypothetical protein [Candidatus Hydrogenedentota bacterium]
MKRNYLMCMRVVIGMCLLCIGYAPFATASETSSIAVTAGDPADLVQNVLIQGCLTASNVTFRGDAQQIGQFTREADNPNFPLEAGIILSSGKAADAIGPGSGEGTDVSTAFTLNDDDDLKALGVNLWGELFTTVRDPAALEFDFVPAGEVIEFRYIFASDEYVSCGNTWNDVFGFFVSGPGIDGDFSNDAINVGVLPDGSPVNIKNIHPANGILCGPVNEEYYVGVPEGDPTISYDGRTIVMTARMENLVPCETYHIKLAVCDIGGIFGNRNDDTAIFIEAKSFDTTDPVVIRNFQEEEETLDVFQGCDPNEIRFYRGEEVDISEAVEVDYEILGTAVYGTHHDLMAGTVTIPANVEYAAVPYTLPVVALDAIKTIIVRVNLSCPCDETLTYVEADITLHDPFVMESLTAQDATSCVEPDGSITALAGPGVSDVGYLFIYELYDNADVLLDTQSPGADTAAVFTALGNGIYKVRVTSEQSCNVLEDYVTVNAPDAPDLLVSSNSPVCESGTIQLTASSQTSGLSYSWTGPDDFASTEANPSIGNASIASAGVYSVTITAPNGCTNSGNTEVTVLPLPLVFCPDGFAVCIESGAVPLMGATPEGGVYNGPGVADGIFDPVAAGGGDHGITYTYTDPVTECSNFCTFTITVYDCDDGLSCTIDSCDPISGCTNTPDDALCDDNNVCNGVETCDPVDGCQAGTPLTCDDGNVCNGVEICDPVNGCQAGTPLTCDDGDVCNGMETCDPVNGCQAGTPLACDDGDVCNGVETCDPVNGCQSGTPLTCDDGNVCNGLETCDPADGCQAGTPLACDDGDVCNGVETCDPVNGCQAGTPLDCDDNDPCTDDYCDPSIGDCLHIPIDGCEASLDCPEEGTLEGLGQPLGNFLANERLMYYLSDDLLWQDIPLPLENFSYDVEARICDVHWWGVEVDGMGNDCWQAENTFAILVGGSLGMEERVVVPERQVVAEGVLMTDSDGLNTAELTVYRYDVSEEALGGCIDISPEGGEYLLSIRSINTAPQNVKNDISGCYFGWINTLEGDGILYEVPLEGAPAPKDGVEDALAFCLTGYDVLPEGEGEVPVEGEGEVPVEGEGEVPVEGEGEVPVEGEGEVPVEG